MLIATNVDQLVKAGIITKTPTFAENNQQDYYTVADGYAVECDVGDGTYGSFVYVYRDRSSGDVRMVDIHNNDYEQEYSDEFLIQLYKQVDSLDGEIA